MKFSNGCWLMKEGVRVMHPAEARSLRIDSASVTVIAPVKPIVTRADSHDISVLTVTLRAVMDDVIAVRITHWSGEKPRVPRFSLREEHAAGASVARDGDGALLTSGRLSARISSKPWGLELSAGGRRLTGSGHHGMGYVETADGGCVIHEQLSLGVGETVYGMGERFTPLVKNGQVVEIWNADGGTGSEQAYKNVPFYLTNRGYGVFVNDPGPVSFEVGSERTTRVQFSVPGQSLEYMVIYGPTPKEVLEKYTALTGRPALPPAWSFGLWLSTSFTTSYDEGTVTEMIRRMEAEKIPLHVFHFDTFWMREMQWCDFTWDPAVFPDPAGMITRLKGRGLHVCLWINPYIAQASPLFEEGMREGFLVKRRDGGVWQWDLWQPGMGLVDFTNPAACRWYRGKLEPLLDMGVDAFKTDFAERVPTDVVWHDGSDPSRMHNYYTFLYNKTVFDLLAEKRGAGEAVVFARSATAGGQCFPVHWGGDNESTFESMAETLRGGLSLGLSGFGFWSHDIGGFEGMPRADLYKRWIAFGLLSSHSRLHGSTSYRVPWLFDQESVEVLARFTRLKCRLMPYLYAKADEASRIGVPVMRAMILEFPEDPACAYLDRQYMLGDSILVAPVFSEDGIVDYYLPAGEWTSLITGEVKHGPGWQRERHDFTSLPLMVREGSMIAMGARDDRPDYPYAEDVTAALYRLAPGKSARITVPRPSGGDAGTIEASRDGAVVSVSWREELGCVRVRLVGEPRASYAGGAVVREEPDGVVVMPAPGAHSVRVVLPEG